MVKFRMIIGDQACEWLNQMSEKGYRLVSFGGGFWKFEPCKPRSYMYESDFDAPLVDKEAYRARIAKRGASVIGTWGSWAVLAGPATTNMRQLVQSSVEKNIEQRTKQLWFCKLQTLATIALCPLLLWLAWLLRENPAACATVASFVVLVSAVSILLTRQTFLVRRELDSVKAELGTAVFSVRRVPILIGIGCLLIGIGPLIDGLWGPSPLRHLLSGLGCALVFVGVFKQIRQRTK